MTENCMNEISTREAGDKFCLEGNVTWAGLGGRIQHSSQGFLEHVQF